MVTGSTYWGHDTGVTETNVRDFAGNWTGTAIIVGAGDDEQICLSSGEYMVSELVNSGPYTVTLVQNKYDGTGDDVTMHYRHGATEADCLDASYLLYTGSFTSLGIVQTRLTTGLEFFTVGVSKIGGSDKIK
jgi:hypothetical protein